MSGYIVAPAAQADIDAIADWITERNPTAAVRFVNEIHDSFAFLARHPNAGHRRQDLTDRPVLFWTVKGRFAVVYRRSSPVEIAHVFPWKRDVATLLSEEGV